MGARNYGGKYVRQGEDGSFEEVQLSGKAQTVQGSVGGVKSWVQKTHPHRATWLRAEERSRASYIATREALVPYLVPHRFEGGVSAQGVKLPRARLGFGLRLNAMYLAEIMGHVRSASKRYTWGPMAPGGAQEITVAPTGGLAKLLWDDATRDGTTWANFFERDVLEWILSSPGGLVLVDATAAPEGAEIRTQKDVEVHKIRPFVTFLPMSAVEDCGRDDTGYRWIQFGEVVDERGPRDADREKGLTARHILVDREGGVARLQRYDDEAKPIGEEVAYTTLGGLMPIVEAKYGQHPDLPWLGAGLLLGLDDIVLDLYNVYSETREGYRDSAFGMLAYTGTDPDTVRDMLAEGSRFVALGPGEGGTSLARVSGDATEVDAGMRLLELGFQAWALSARRNAAKAMEAQAQSGVSLQAEFSLDLKPLLVEVCRLLDQVETNAMYLAGLLAGHKPEALKDVGVVRETEFRLEDEDTRIARKIEEFAKSLSIPPSAQSRMTTRWVEATGLVDLDEVVEHEVEVEDAVPEVDPVTGLPGAKPTTVEKKTLREVVQAEAEEIAQTSKTAANLAATYQPMGLGDESGGGF